MLNDIFNREEVYEAIYIARKIHGSNIKNSLIKQSSINAIERILSVTNLTNINDMDVFLKKYKTKKLDIQSEALYSKLRNNNEGSFFNIISEEELYLYHYYNYEVSFEYGVNLSKTFNFENKNILDIGGSSGGLCGGIKKCFNSSNCTVYDTFIACKIGEELVQNKNMGISFIGGNIFSKANINEHFDYIILSNIIHDWNDTNAISIFRNISHLLEANTKLLIYEDLLFGEGLKPLETLIYGLRLCANVPEGRQRTVEKLKKLIENALNTKIKIKQVVNFGVHSAMIISL